MTAPGKGAGMGGAAPSRERPVSRAEARRRLGRLAAYHVVFAESRPADMPPVEAAMKRYRAIAKGKPMPDERQGSEEEVA